MKARWSYFIAFLLLAAVAASAVLTWPAFYVVVIDPIVRVFWLLIRTLSTVDQEVYWVLLITAGFVLVAVMIPSRRENYPHAYNMARRVPEDRIAYWKTLLESAQNSDNARLALEHDLTDLCKAAASVGMIQETDRVVLPKGNPTSRFAALFPWKNRHTSPDLLKSTAQLITSMENALEIENDRTN